MKLARLILSPLSLQDLQDIHDYIACDNPDAASALLDRIDSRIEMLREHPEIGRRREELPVGLRCIAEGNYLIIYRLLAEQNTLQVVRVLHGKRNIKRILKGNNG